MGAHKPLQWPRQLVTAAGIIFVLLVFCVRVVIWGGGGFWEEGFGGSGRRYAAGWRHAELSPSSLQASLTWAAAAPRLFSMSPLAPSRAMYYAMQAKPEIASSDPALAAEFEAAPWLLPARTRALPYAGVHDFDQLVALRSRPAGRWDKSVAFLLFSKPYAVMVQNSVYSLVKHGGVRNYVAVAWSAEDLEACADLNLPCANVTGMLLEPIITNKLLLQHDFLVMQWVKAAMVSRALQRGYAVMQVDTDVAYSVKPVWDSYLEFIERGEADGAWQSESPLNSGHFVLLPTPAGVAFAAAWNASAPAMLQEKVSEQKALPFLEGKAFQLCRTLCLCYKHKYDLLEEGRRDEVAVFRAALPGYFPYTLSGCTVGSKEWVPSIDPCDWQVLYVHPICAQGAASKEEIFRQIGFWFMDNDQGCKPQPGSASQVPACRPLHWRLPDAESKLYSCPSFGLGLVHGDVPPAVKALQAGASAEVARALLKASADKECNGKPMLPVQKPPCISS